MILGGLIEGTWPASALPDPWLAPRIRAELGLPGLERNIGVAAHDFANALGAPKVLITRARRDGRSPAPNFGDRGRAAQGRPLRFLRAAHAQTVAYRSGRRRTERGVARQSGPRDPAGLVRTRWRGPRQAAPARGSVAWRRPHASDDSRLVGAAADRSDRLDRVRSFRARRRAHDPSGRGARGARYLRGRAVGAGRPE